MLLVPQLVLVENYFYPDGRVFVAPACPLNRYDNPRCPSFRGLLPNFPLHEEPFEIKILVLHLGTGKRLAGRLPDHPILSDFPGLFYDGKKGLDFFAADVLSFGSGFGEL